MTVPAAVTSPRSQTPETAVDEPEAVFIVGVPRSGTTMMREILERSDRIAIARENHFVGHVRRGEGARYYFRQAGDLRDDETLRRIVAMIYTGEFQQRSRWREVSPFWRWLPKNIEQAELERRLLGAERTERGIFEAMLRAYADAQEKPVMGEKTPAHLAYVDTLLEWFPGARVVHMIRDPRAVYVSDLRRRRQKPRRPYSWLGKVPFLLQTVLMTQIIIGWRAAVARHQRYQRQYAGRYTLVRFEDVVREPQMKVPEIFAFLGVAAPTDATDVRVVSHGYNRGEQGIDAAAADRWRGYIHPVARRILTFFLRRPMARVGYTTA